jgi:hypothetical protein
VQVRKRAATDPFRDFSTSELATSGEILETRRDFRRTLFCTTERDEELLISMAGILGFFVVFNNRRVYRRQIYPLLSNYRCKIAIRRVFTRHNGRLTHSWSSALLE